MTKENKINSNFSNIINQINKMKIIKHTYKNNN